MTAITELATHGHERPHARSQAVVVCGLVRAARNRMSSSPQLGVTPVTPLYRGWGLDAAISHFEGLGDISGRWRGA